MIYLVTWSFLGHKHAMRSLIGRFIAVNLPGLRDISRSTVVTEVASLVLLLLRRHLGHKAEVSNKRVSRIATGHYSS